MEDEQALALFREVLTKTKSGKLRWEETANESEYLTTLPGEFVLRVSRSDELNSWGDKLREQIELTLRDREQELLRITDDIEGITWKELDELHQLARRHALNVDAKVGKLLGELTRL